MRRFKLWLAVLCAAGLSAAGAGAVDSERLGGVAARMQSFVDRGEAAGIVTLVLLHGKVVQQSAVGFSDLEAKRPMRTDSIFQIMSMTKPVTGVGIMMLAEEGRLGLNDPVEKYLPEFRGQRMIKSRSGADITLGKPSRPITIRDLMTHESGMGDSPAALELYQRMNRTLAEAVAIFSQQPLEFEPGARWRYSNMGIATLGRIIEVVSEQPYDRFLEERIFRPLGMKDTFFFPPPGKLDRIALVYKPEKGKLVRADASILGGDPAEYRKGARYPAPEFGLYSTAADLASFYEMMLAGGLHQGKRVLSRESVEIMTTVQDPNLPPPTGWFAGGHYALTWEVIQDAPGRLLYFSPGAYGHGGAFGTLGWIDRKKDLVGVYMVQLSGVSNDGARTAFLNMVGSAIEQ